MNHLSQPELREKLKIGKTFCNRICRAIDNHTDIYSDLARLGNKYDLYAFTHARKYLKELEGGKPVPPFDQDEIKKVWDEESFKEERLYAEDELRLDLIDKIDDWFRVTEIPEKMNAKQLARIIRLAMITIVSN